MSTFVAAYLVLWAGVLCYVLRLGARQRRLERAIELLSGSARCGATVPAASAGEMTARQL
jgi:CcmD family protein